MKNNLEYYRHYVSSDQHPKFKALRVKYGWQGEGRFWAINNRIAQSDNCELDLSKERNRATIAVDLGLSLQKFDEFIQFLASDFCELLKNIGNEIYTNEMLKENIDKVSDTREAGRIRQEQYKERNSERFKKRVDDALLGQNNALLSDLEEKKRVTEEQSKVKESKVKETKANESKEAYSPAVVADVENYNDLEQYLLQQWGREGRIGYSMLTELIELGKTNTKEKLYEAIKIAAEKNVKNISYVKGIFRKWDDEGAKKTVIQKSKERLIISFFCECGESQALDKLELIRASDYSRALRCPKCYKQYPAGDILKKEINGVADFINYQKQEVA